MLACACQPLPAVPVSAQDSLLQLATCCTYDLCCTATCHHREGPLHAGPKPQRLQFAKRCTSLRVCRSALHSAKRQRDLILINACTNTHGAPIWHPPGDLVVGLWESHACKCTCCQYKRPLLCLQVLLYRMFVCRRTLQGC
jgi:hypothetical protein